METGMVDYFMAYNLSKFDGWALIEAWAAIGMNTVIFTIQSNCLSHAFYCKAMLKLNVNKTVGNSS